MHFDVFSLVKCMPLMVQSYFVIFHSLMGACSKTISAHFHVFFIIYLGHQSKPLSRGGGGWMNAPAERCDLT